MAAKKKKTIAATARGKTPRAVPRARGKKKAQARETARRSKAAKKGWATRRARAEKRSEAAKKGWETRRAALEPVKPKKPAPKPAKPAPKPKKPAKPAPKPKKPSRAELEKEQRSEAAKRGWEARRQKEREAEAARLEAQRLEAERLAKELEEQAKKEKRKAAAKLRAQRRAEKLRVCKDLIDDPPSDPELVFGTDCFDFSRFHQYRDGSWEGEIVDRARKDFRRTWDRLERFLRPTLAPAKGWWVRVGVFGSEPGALGQDDPNFDRDRYQKNRQEWGKAFVPGSIGRYTGWRRIKPTKGARTKFTTFATMMLLGREITDRFVKKGFVNVVLSVEVFTGHDRPEGN